MIIIINRYSYYPHITGKKQYKNKGSYFEIVTILNTREKRGICTFYIEYKEELAGTLPFFVEYRIGVNVDI